MATKHKRPPSAVGELCTLCKKNAYHKVSEDQLAPLFSSPYSNNPSGIEYAFCGMSAYICCACWSKLMNSYCVPEEEV